jgi:hypothetical protein
MPGPVFAVSARWGGPACGSPLAAVRTRTSASSASSRLGTPALGRKVLVSETLIIEAALRREARWCVCLHLHHHGVQGRGQPESTYCERSRLRLGRLSWADSGPTRLTRESTLLPALRHCKPSFKKAGAHALRRPRLAVRFEPTRPRTRAASKHLNAQGSRRRALRRRRSRSGMLSISVRQRRWSLHSASHNCEHLRSRDRRQMVMERH